MQKSTHLVHVVISDGELPIQSSTGTLTIRVCTCDRDGNMEMCNAEALTSAAGLSTGALVAILLCILILLCKFYLHLPPLVSLTIRSLLSPSIYLITAASICLSDCESDRSSFKAFVSESFHFPTCLPVS